MGDPAGLTTTGGSDQEALVAKSNGVSQKRMNFLEMACRKSDEAIVVMRLRESGEERRASVI